jgi:hypothetical protein
MMMQSVGIFAVVLLAVNALFQLALTAGIRWGNVAFGGKVAKDDGSLPTRYRVMSLVSAIIMGLLILVIISADGRGASFMSADFTVWTYRCVSVLFALNTVGNIVSDSNVERWVMGSMTTSLAVSFGLMGWII